MAKRRKRRQSAEAGAAPGRCCACGRSGLLLRHYLLLDLLAPVPGYGWGCIVCELPMDGALAVVCGPCFNERRHLMYAIRGPSNSGERVLVADLGGPFGHDMTKHVEEDFYAAGLNN